MKTYNYSINDVLEKNATSFFIPPFQRAYAWGRQEIERYFNDISLIIDSELDDKTHDKLEHFFGTLVIKNEKDGLAHRTIVVDGQQRLTTTLIFLIALRDLDSDKSNKDHITDTYLINNKSNFPDKIKLKQTTKDWESYRALVTGNLKQSGGVIYNAYLLFIKLINNKKKIKASISLNHYITAIGRMNIALIELDERPFKGEDPQIIFETLNSLGKPLSLSDLIRNYVLLTMDSNKQSDVYEKTWHPLIELVLNDNTSAFLRDYLQLKKSSAVKAVSDNNTKEIYHIFKEYVEDRFNNHIHFINEVVSYSKWYNWIITTENSEKISTTVQNDKEIKELLRNIFHDIKAEAFKPLVLGLLEKHQTSIDGLTLSDERLIYILEIIRTYLIRRRILSLTQGENKEIVNLCNHINRIITGNVDIIELLSSMFYRLRLPNDKDMTTQLVSMNFYELKKYSKFILGKIEEYNSKVPVDFRNPKITIEHIMPQKLTRLWEIELGQNHKAIHETYLHNIGNIILTEFNSEIGNKSFSEKKSKLKTSNLYYRNSVDKSVWNEANINEHQTEMIKWFLATFPIPDNYKDSSNWNIKDPESKNISPLDSDVGDIVEGNKPEELRIDKIVIKVKTWQDVFIKFLSHIKDSSNYDFDLIIENQTELSNKNEIILKWSVLSSLIDKNSDLSLRYKTFDGKCWKDVKSLNDDDLFIHINISASICMKRIAYIMNMYNIPEQSVEILLK